VGGEGTLASWFSGETLLIQPGKGGDSTQGKGPQALEKDGKSWQQGERSKRVCACNNPNGGDYRRGVPRESGELKMPSGKEKNIHECNKTGEKEILRTPAEGRGEGCW